MRRRGARRSRDHPRSRGVYSGMLCADHIAWGSSPLARGLHPESDRVVHVHGIIPARAGFTHRKDPHHEPVRDHPRSRGVYSTDSPTRIRIVGSSPLARGLRQSARASTSTSRIIPARAGFTARPGWRPCRVRDHPRSRGVYEALSASDATDKGSSPLARGLLSQALTVSEEVGIIPARAGFTSTTVRLSSRDQDHPRSRGVYRRRGRPW